MPLDLRVAFRRLARQLPATIAAVLTLGLGIGAITALFSVVDAVLLRPLPFRAPGRLAAIDLVPRDRPGTRLEISYPDYRGWRVGTRSFEDLAAVQTALGRTVWESGGEARAEQGSLVSGHLFALLGAAPRLGRTLGNADDVPGAERAIVLSDGLWRRAFDGRANALGRQVRLDGLAHTVVGVMPPDFDYPRNAAFWRAIVPAVDSLADKRGIGFLSVAGRLRPGVTLASAERETSDLADRVARQGLAPDAHVAVRVVDLTERLIGGARPVLLVAFGATGLVLIIACVNVASLLLAQAPGRRRELAVRTALGAPRGRLVRQLLLESLVLGAAGALLGVVLAVAAVRALGALVPAELFRAELVAVDPEAVAFAALVALVAAAGFGVAPAVAGARADPQAVLRGGGRGSSGRGARRFLRALVVAETAVAMILLVGAGLLVNAFLRLRAVDPGPDPERTLTVQVFTSDQRYADATQSHALFARLVETAGTLPGVEAVAGVLLRPLEGPQGFDYPFTIEGRTREEQAAHPLLNYEAVTPDFFRSRGAARPPRARAHRRRPDRHAAGRRAGRVRRATVLARCGSDRAAAQVGRARQPVTLGHGQGCGRGQPLPRARAGEPRRLRAVRAEPLAPQPSECCGRRPSRRA